MSATAPKQSKKQQQVNKMVDLLRRSKTPVKLNDLCEKVDAKYPQDVNAAMFALEHVGLVTLTEDGYLWKKPAAS